MSAIKEKYKLEFSKRAVNGKIYAICDRLGPVQMLHYLPGFLEALHPIEINGLIEEIEAAQNGEYYEEYPQSEGYEHYDVQIKIPNFLLATPGPVPLLESNSAIIPLKDMRVLLMEWKKFKHDATMH